MGQHSDDKNKDLCADCSLCCEAVTIELDPPTDYEDLDNILWYVLHKDVVVYLDEEDDWYISFKAKCEALDDAKLCTAYNTRPNVCREYTQDGCEKYGDGPFWKVLFANRQMWLDHIEKTPRLKKIWDKGMQKMMEKSLKANAKASQVIAP